MFDTMKSSVYVAIGLRVALPASVVPDRVTVQPPDPRVRFLSVSEFQSFRPPTCYPRRLSAVITVTQQY